MKSKIHAPLTKPLLKPSEMVGILHEIFVHFRLRKTLIKTKRNGMFSGTTIHAKAALTNPLLKQMRNSCFCTWNVGILRPARNLIKPKDFDGFLAALRAP